MHEIPRVLAQVQPLEDTSYLLERSLPTLVKKGFLYFLVDPFIITDLTWLGVSLICARFNCTVSQPFSIVRIVRPPENVNFCLMVAWKVSEGVAKRYKLWSGVGERVYAPDYSGEQIPATFWLEVWTTEGDNATLGETLSLQSSIIIDDETNRCVDPNAQQLIDSLLCIDNLFFYRDDFDPAFGDYWDFDDCGNGTFVNVGDPEPDLDLCAVILPENDSEYGGGDNFECYVGGTSLQGLNAGSAYLGGWNVVGLFIGIVSIEHFNEYPEEVTLQDKNAGTGWGGGWKIVELDL